MAYEIHLSKLDDDFENHIPISKQEWIECVNKLQDLKYVEEEFPDSIQTYSEQYQDWIPIFWIMNGSGSMRASGFFDSDVSYEKAIEIAEYLSAYIYGDENEVYYLPGYGIIYDDVEIENPEVSLDDLRKYKHVYGSDYKRIIETVEKEKKLKKNRSASMIPKSKRENIMSIWTIITIVMVILCIFYLIIIGR